MLEHHTEIPAENQLDKPLFDHTSRTWQTNAEIMAIEMSGVTLRWPSGSAEQQASYRVYRQELSSQPAAQRPKPRQLRTAIMARKHAFTQRKYYRVFRSKGRSLQFLQHEAAAHPGGLWAVLAAATALPPSRITLMQHLYFLASQRGDEIPVDTTEGKQIEFIPDLRVTRAELSNRTGISTTELSRAMKDLVRVGLVSGRLDPDKLTSRSGLKGTAGWSGWDLALQPVSYSQLKALRVNWNLFPAGTVAKNILFNIDDTQWVADQLTNLSLGVLYFISEVLEKHYANESQGHAGQQCLTVVKNLIESIPAE